jgi:hypothetical protein
MVEWPLGPVVKLLLLTAQRRDEVADPCCMSKCGETNQGPGRPPPGKSLVSNGGYAPAV